MCEIIKNVSVDEFSKKLDLTVIANGSGFIELSSISVSRPGLYLAGYYEKFPNRRVQVIGNAEHQFLKRLEKKARYKAIKKLYESDICCLIISRNLSVPEEIETLANEYHCALMASDKVTTVLIHDLMAYLSEVLAPTDYLHGVLLDVSGIGVLITGETGIGKSETALELINRGHRLVADDTVMVIDSGDKIIGKSPSNIQYYMDVRGIGIINVKTMYGSGAVRPEKAVDIVCELIPYKPDMAYDRLGNHKIYTSILGKKILTFKIPVQPGRNIPTIIEAAAKKYRLEEQLNYSAINELIKNTFS
ncbi:MAG: HPr(Ser) kinase/phosphatase [Christensenellaceae bacterium]